MANHQVDLHYADGGVGAYTSPASLDFVRPGDTVQFVSQTFHTTSVSGFSGTYWTNTGTIPDGTKTLKTGAPDNTTTSVICTIRGEQVSVPIQLRVKDEHPDSFGLTDVSNINPKAIFEPHVVTVNGINTEVNWSISSSAGRYAKATPLSKTTNYPRSSGKISNGQKLYLEVEAEYDYSEQLTITLTVGTRTASFKVINKQWPDVDELIYINVPTPPILFMGHVVAFFGRKQDDPLLTDYLRGNDLVPNIQQNDHVPTSPPIEITDLADTYSALYFRYRPPNKSITADTSTGTKSLQLTWNIETDYNVGYGDMAKDLVYWYAITHDAHQGAHATQMSNSDVQIISGSGEVYNQPTAGNQVITLAVNNSGANVEKFYRGNLTIYCKNQRDNLTISQTVKYSIMFFGP